MLRNFGSQLIRQSLAPSSQKAYSSGFRSQTAFRGLLGKAQYLDAAESLTENTQALLEFAAWCGVSEGNQASTIASKVAAVLHFHRVEAQMELPTSSPLIKRALNGVERSHVAAGTSKRVRRSVSWDTLGGQNLAPSWGPGGRVLWMCLALGYLFVARSNEIFASVSGVVHPVHFLTRGDVALYAGGRQLGSLQWHQATSIDVSFRGHKGLIPVTSQ